MLIGPVSILQAQLPPKSTPQEQKVEVQSNGSAVILDGEELFLIQARTGSFSPEERAQAVQSRLESIAKDLSTSGDEIKIDEQEQLTSIVAGERLIITITPEDARLRDLSAQKLAEEYVQIIKSSIDRYRGDHSVKGLIFDLVYASDCRYSS